MSTPFSMRARPTTVILTGVVFAATLLAACRAGAADATSAPGRARRVLLVHSFGGSVPPFTTHSTAFESALKHELGADVDLDQVSLENARYAQPDLEDAFAE